MNENEMNFQKWFKQPLSNLYSNPNAGFIILMISLPLLERYLREKSKTFEASLKDEFFYELITIFPALKELPVAKKFWEVYRHGLLHQATLKVRDLSLSVGVYNSTDEIIHGYNNNGDNFCVSPNAFSNRIILTIENDFATFEGNNSPKHPMSTIDPNSGRSGFSIKDNG